MDLTVPRVLESSGGVPFAKLHTIPYGDFSRAFGIDWIPERCAPRGEEGSSVLGEVIEDLRSRGIRLFETRVTTSDSDVESSLTAARADWYRALLVRFGFTRRSSRLEFRLPLEEAIAALHNDATSNRLTWTPIATEPGAAIERAARVLDAAAVGDPTHDPDDDALGFLLARREDSALVLPPESLEIGQFEGVDAAIVIASVQPKTGWCSHYYLGVLPEYRGRGFGLEAMRRGFATMRRLGGRTYHDGTGEGNLAALALFRHLGASPYRRMEQWHLAD